MCRECIRSENGFSEQIELGKKRDHFECNKLNLVTIESVG